MRLFFLVAFAVAWAVSLPPALAQLGLIDPIVPWGVGILIGIAPAIAAAVAARHLRLQGFWRSAFRFPSFFWLLVAPGLPLLLLALAYGLSAMRGDPIALSLGPDILVFAVLWLLLAFGEEVGWRGFALPRLNARYGFWMGSFILGLIWCVWHYPRLLGSPYLGSLSEAAPLIALFSVQILIANFIICWLYYRSGRSVIAATLYHASFNVVATIYFLAATDPIFTGLLAVFAAGIALFDRPWSRWSSEGGASEGVGPAQDAQPATKTRIDEPNPA